MLEHERIVHVPVATMIRLGYWAPWPLVRMWGGVYTEAILCKN